MIRTDFTQYDVMPEDFINYLRYNGPHFSKKLVQYAAKYMNKGDEDKPIKSYTKDEVDSLLSSYGIKLKNNILYDYVYIANWCKADFLGSSIKDDEHMALFIKDCIDDKDAYDGMIFNRWYADICKKGIRPDWEELL